MKTLVLGALLLALAPQSGRGADTLDLAGEWRLRLDPEDAGLAAGWLAAPLVTADRIALPNTTDRAGFGFALDTNTLLHAAPFPPTTRFPGVKDPARADEHGYLVRRHLFVGPAWYERDIVIPAAWQDRPVLLRIERALWRTDAWLDGRPCGSEDSLVAEHRHSLGILEPGRHRLTVRVDNRLIHNIGTATHAYGPETQSRWNGLVGSITLEASYPVAIESLDAFPAADRRSIEAALRLANAGSTSATATVRVDLLPEFADQPLAGTSVELVCPAGRSTNRIRLTLDAPAQAWDEFHPVRYRLRARLETAGSAPRTSIVKFGFRQVDRRGRQLRLDGRPIFLRGTLDCAVYPLTGHPPMTVPEWERIFGVIKTYGFNHVRYHTWCPPDAAFEAADRLGLYLQPETPAWVDDWTTGTVTKPAGIGRDTDVTGFLRAELSRMSEAYGNHPSFLLCSIGNEFGLQNTDWVRVNALVEEIKGRDPRRLYTGCGARKHLDADDFWYTHQTGAPTRGVGPPHTDWDFAHALETSPVPLIAHETGQRPVFPDYASLLPRFAGPLLPLNYERYQRALGASGLADQNRDFTRASARFQLTQYKAEHEAMLRTRGYGGYQLLMLNDFTGQSEALVGILDPFWESKGVVAPAEVRAWNAPTVLLARFPKFVWTTDETLTARIEVAHFGPADLPAGRVEWSLGAREDPGSPRGGFETATVPAGSVSSLGTLDLKLDRLAPPRQLVLEVRFAGVANHWPMWVYPAGPEPPVPANVRIARALDEAALGALEAGGRVLLLAHGLKNAHTARTGFESVYWSAGWWGNKFSTLGLLCDPRHPALAAFPNDGVADWQWHTLCAGATTFDLDGAPADLRPIVQPVPDFHFNSRLAHVFEARVGHGSLLVCGYDLDTDLERRPAARQFRRSLLDYAASDAFRPTLEVPLTWVERHLASAGRQRRGARNLGVDSEETANLDVVSPGQSRQKPRP
jgi:hypothetical protein